MRAKRSADSRYPKPYSGEVVYLDIPSNRAADLLEKNLKLLGATVEKCFSRDVTLVVSDSPDGSTNRPNQHQQVSPSPSPMTPSPYMAALRGSANSPQADSPGASANISQFSRGAKMVTKANVTKNRGTSNIIKIAERLKIQVISSQELRQKMHKDLAKVPSDVKLAADNKAKAIEKRKDVHCGREHKVKKLTGNVLKFEDHSRHYRPVHQKVPDWPVLHTEAPSKGSPFLPEKGRARQAGTEEEIERAERPGQRDSHVVNHTAREEHTKEEHPKEEQTASTQKDGKKKNPSRKSRSCGGQKNSAPPPRGGTKEEGGEGDGLADVGPRLFTAGELRRIMVEKRRAEMNRGYCEMCRVKFEDMNKHFSSDQHRNFVRDANNFAELDAMIESGPNMDQFLDDVIKYHALHMKQGLEESEMEDEILLIKEGYSSPLVKPRKTPLRARKPPERPTIPKSHAQSSKKQLRFAEGNGQKGNLADKNDAKEKRLSKISADVPQAKSPKREGKGEGGRLKRKASDGEGGGSDEEAHSPVKRTRNRPRASEGEGGASVGMHVQEQEPCKERAWTRVQKVEPRAETAKTRVQKQLPCAETSRTTRPCTKTPERRSKLPAHQESDAHSPETPRTRARKRESLAKSPASPGGRRVQKQDSVRPAPASPKAGAEKRGQGEEVETSPVRTPRTRARTHGAGVERQENTVTPSPNKLPVTPRSRGHKPEVERQALETPTRVHLTPGTASTQVTRTQKQKLRDDSRQSQVRDFSDSPRGQRNVPCASSGDLQQVREAAQDAKSPSDVGVTSLSKSLRSASKCCEASSQYRPADVSKGVDSRRSSPLKSRVDSPHRGTPRKNLRDIVNVQDSSPKTSSKIELSLANSPQVRVRLERISEDALHNRHKGETASLCVNNEVKSVTKQTARDHCDVTMGEKCEKEDGVCETNKSSPLSYFSQEGIDKCMAALKGMDWSNIMFDSRRGRDRTKSGARDNARVDPCDPEAACDSPRRTVIKRAAGKPDDASSAVSDGGNERQAREPEVDSCDAENGRANRKRESHDRKGLGSVLQACSPLRSRCVNSNSSPVNNCRVRSKSRAENDAMQSQGDVTSQNCKSGKRAGKKMPAAREGGAGHVSDDVTGGDDLRHELTPKRGKIRGGSRNNAGAAHYAGCSEAVDERYDGDDDTDSDGAVAPALRVPSPGRECVTSGNEICSETSRSFNDQSKRRNKMYRSWKRKCGESPRATRRQSVAASPVRILATREGGARLRELRVQLCRDVIEKHRDLLDHCESGSQRSFVCSEEIEVELLLGGGGEGGGRGGGKVDEGAAREESLRSERLHDEETAKTHEKSETVMQDYAESVIAKHKDRERNETAVQIYQKITENVHTYEGFRNRADFKNTNSESLCKSVVDTGKETARQNTHRVSESSCKDSHNASEAPCQINDKENGKVPRQRSNEGKQRVRSPLGESKENRSPTKQSQRKPATKTTPSDVLKCKGNVDSAVNRKEPISGVASKLNKPITVERRMTKDKHSKPKVKKKLGSSMQVLSDRSMLKILQSEGENEGFEGFTATSAEHLPLDVSYSEVDELELTDHSDYELVVSDEQHGQWSQPKASANGAEIAHDDLEENVVGESPDNAHRMLDVAFSKYLGADTEKDLFASSPKKARYLTSAPRRSPRKLNRSLPALPLYGPPPPNSQPFGESVTLSRSGGRRSPRKQQTPVGRSDVRLRRSPRKSALTGSSRSTAMNRSLDSCCGTISSQDASLGALERVEASSNEGDTLSVTDSSLHECGLFVSTPFSGSKSERKPPQVGRTMTGNSLPFLNALFSSSLHSIGHTGDNDKSSAQSQYSNKVNSYSSEHRSRFKDSCTRIGLADSTDAQKTTLFGGDFDISPEIGHVRSPVRDRSEMSKQDCLPSLHGIRFHPADIKLTNQSGLKEPSPDWRIDGFGGLMHSTPVRSHSKHSQTSLGLNNSGQESAHMRKCLRLRSDMLNRLRSEAQMALREPMKTAHPELVSQSDRGTGQHDAELDTTVTLDLSEELNCSLGSEGEVCSEKHSSDADSEITFNLKSRHENTEIKSQCRESGSHYYSRSKSELNRERQAINVASKIRKKSKQNNSESRGRVENNPKRTGPKSNARKSPTFSAWKANEKGVYTFFRVKSRYQRKPLKNRLMHQSQRNLRSRASEYDFDKNTADSDCISDVTRAKQVRLNVQAKRWRNCTKVGEHSGDFSHKSSVKRRCDFKMAACERSLSSGSESFQEMQQCVLSRDAQLSLLAAKVQRGRCLCYEHTPSSTCPNAPSASSAPALGRAQTTRSSARKLMYGGPERAAETPEEVRECANDGRRVGARRSKRSRLESYLDLDGSLDSSSRLCELPAIQRLLFKERRRLKDSLSICS